MPNLAIIQRMKNGRINISFDDNLIQSENVNDAVMAYDKERKQFIDLIHYHRKTDKERFIYYVPENPLFAEFFGEFMPGYIQTLNKLDIPAKPSQYIGVSKDVDNEQYREYLSQLPIPPLETVLRENNDAS